MCSTICACVNSRCSAASARGISELAKDEVAPTRRTPPRRPPTLRARGAEPLDLRMHPVRIEQQRVCLCRRHQSSATAMEELVAETILAVPQRLRQRGLRDMQAYRQRPSSCGNASRLRKISISRAVIGRWSVYTTPGAGVMARSHLSVARDLQIVLRYSLMIVLVSGGTQLFGRSMIDEGDVQGLADGDRIVINLPAPCNGLVSTDAG